MVSAPPPGSPFEVLTVEQLRRRSSVKWERYGPEVVPVWVAEMDLLPAPEVVEALCAAVRAGDTGYPSSTPVYAEAFAEFAGGRWGWTPDVADTSMCADAMTGIRVLVEALVAPGGRVVIPSPVYPPFAQFTREAQRRVVPVGLTPTGRLDLAAIEAALAAGPAVLLLCSPHNPTGVVHTRGELAAVADVAARHGASVVVDEVHGPLVSDPVRFVPWLAVSDRGFAVTSAAKAFNLAGLKAAIMVAGPESRDALRRLPDGVRFGASHLGVIGHAAAYRADPAWLDSVNVAVAANATRLRERLAEQLPEVRMQVPEATYLAWLDCRDTGLGDDPAAAFLAHGQVALTAGMPFGRGGRGFARFNVACSAEVLDEAVRRMATALHHVADGAPSRS